MKHFIYLAEVTTRNFTFMAIHTTDLGAVNALQIIFEKQIKQLDGTLTWADIESDVFVKAHNIGEGWVC
jgi:hypothetical protein